MTITPLLAAARKRGCVISTGRDMVEAQIELVAAFLGLPAPASVPGAALSNAQVNVAGGTNG